MSLKIAQVATADLSIRFLLLEHIQALEKMGHEVVAVCAPGPWIDEIRRLGVAVETVSMARELRPMQDLRSTRDLVRCFRRHKFDVVHTHTPKAGLLGPLAARIAKVPVVVHTIHGLLFHDRMPAWKRAIYWLPEKWTAAYCDYLLSQSAEDIATAVRTGICSGKQIAFIGNGVDVNRFSPDVSRTRNDNDIVIGSVGRLVHEKGFAELFEAAELLLEAHPRLRFLVVGPEEHDQDDAIDGSHLAALSRTGKIRFIGWGSDMPHWYAQMNIFVLPSHREGVPRACMEAAATGLPVVASDIRGCREVVHDGETGILVPMGNAPALAEAVERLVRDPGLRRRYGAAGMQHIRANFNQELVLERLRVFYAQLERRLKGHGAVA